MRKTTCIHYTVNYGFKDSSNHFSDLNSYDLECLKEAMREYNEKSTRSDNKKHILEIELWMRKNCIKIFFTSERLLTKGREAAALNLLTRCLVEKKNSKWPSFISSDSPGKMFRSK